MTCAGLARSAIPLTRLHDDHVDYQVVTLEPNAAHAPRRPAHRPHVALFEAARHALPRSEHDLVFAARQRDLDQRIIGIKQNRLNPAGPRVGKRSQRRLLDDPLLGREEHELLFERLHCEYRHVPFIGLHRQHVRQRPAAARSRQAGDVVDTQPVDPPAIRENQQVIVRRAHAHLLDKVAVLVLRTAYAPAAAPLRTVRVRRHALDIPLVSTSLRRTVWFPT